jgi:hypothetical protein
MMTDTKPRFISPYFDQSGESLDYISEHGVQAWLNMLDGAINFFEGEESDSAPWGKYDSLIYSESFDSNHTLYVHANWHFGYVSITVERNQ